MARAQLVDVSQARRYHRVTRRVRRAFLLGENDYNRKEWLENWLEELADILAVAVGGFSVLDNHLHMLVRLDPGVAEAWSEEEVVRRWGQEGYRYGREHWSLTAA
jgi:REP element-mobilizing transposase RayT